MIYLGLGSNLVDIKGRPPKDAIEAAIAMIAEHEIDVLAIAPFYESAPVPATANLPWFVNTVIAVDTKISPVSVMRLLLDIERQMGRFRQGKKDINKPQSRPVDIDILDWHGMIRGPSLDHDLTLPHPRMQDRAFVVLPMADLAPGWRHPVTGLSIEDYKRQLPPQEIRPL